MTNKTIKKMKTYEVNIDEIHKQKIIKLGKQELIQTQLCRHSLLDLIRSSIQFTRLHTWFIQFALLILTTFLITNVINNESFLFVIQSLTVIVIFSVIFLIDELLRSFTSGMWELEQTLKYDLRQHTIIKLFIFGMVDFLLISCLAFISQGVLEISFWKIILYLLVPFNIICIVLFSLFTIWRNTFSSAVLWISSGIVIVSVLFISNFFNIYELEMKFWGAGYILSLLFLMIVVKDQLKVKKWEALF
ncbi:hypothetical protein M3197_06200 [Sporosarcina aquimarina]|uniref:hypothetical protein n=1 Tax=Sporosarcina aquimarina TaxID=114975 RepID=UPI00203E9E87|nr:hypothetical protein [Sporosarcina aquimarina]MCM3757079.1 hypothetical protein [Sporosarcina aquimarina]